MSRMLPGTTFGGYRVVSLLGEGGMGEVYRASDPQLGRDVALKVLHDSVAGDPDRTRRFLAEAQAIAALNHPNVLTIYEVGTHDGHPFLATELLEGDTLRASLNAGALPASKAMDLARQAASGLAAAHGKGIAHRDIKPENLFVTTDGRLKILDFGLAKSVDRSTAGVDVTRLQSVTAAGTVMGTVGYMSPEQVRAQPVDHRSDIFSLGIVLHEMLTGQRPFAGGSAVETMNAILTVDPPDIITGGRPVPAGLVHVVRHCLEKNPEERFQSARDLAFALQALSGSKTSGAAASVAAPAVAAGQRTPGLRGLGLAAALAVAAAAGAGAAMWTWGASSPDLAAYTFAPFATEAEPEDWPAWSPDGRSVAFVKDGRIFVRPIDGDDATPVTSGRQSIWDVFWFPDNTRIGFISRSASPPFYPAVWAVNRAGGDPELLQKSAFDAAALSPDGGTLALWRNVASGSGMASLYFASPITAEPREYKLGFLDREPSSPNAIDFSPDGRWLAYAGYLPSASMWLIPIDASGEAGPPRRVFEQAEWVDPPDVSWLPDNRSVVLAGDGDLWLGDTGNGALTRITAGVHTLSRPAASPDGSRISVVAGSTNFDLVEIPIADGPATDLLASGRQEISGMWVPSGPGAGDLVYVTDKSGEWEIRLRKPDGSEKVLVGPRTFATRGTGEGLSHAWPSPDGSRVAFARWDGRDATTWVVPITGGVPVGIDSPLALAGIWSPDSKSIASLVAPPGSGPQVNIRRVGSNDPPVTILQGERALIDFYLEWSPNGEWIAFQGQTHISLVSPDGQKRRDLAGVRAAAVAWSHDSRTLYALTRLDRPTSTHDLISIDVATGAERTRRTLPPALLPRAPSLPGLRMSLNAEGTKLAMPVARTRTDVWMLNRKSPR